MNEETLTGNQIRTVADSEYIITTMTHMVPISLYLTRVIMNRE